MLQVWVEKHSVYDEVVRIASRRFLNGDCEFLHEALTGRKLSEKSDPIHVTVLSRIVSFDLDLVWSTRDELSTEDSRWGPSGLVKLDQLEIVRGITTGRWTSDLPVIDIDV